MKFFILTVCASLIASTTAVRAEYQKVENQTEFVSVVSGKKLTRPLVELRVTKAGSIVGKGAAWPVTGNWTWTGGYFCRTLTWGDDDLGYDCQEVLVNKRKIRFTSNKGAGKSAEFTLR